MNKEELVAEISKKSKVTQKEANEVLSALIETVEKTVSKGKNVTLVGVINADLSFNLPDYRSSERGFSILTQVAGRSGRGENEGKVIFQTYLLAFLLIPVIFLSLHIRFPLCILPNNNPPPG